MNTRPSHVVALLSTVLLMSGCAFTKSTVKLDYKPQTYADKVSADAVIVMQKLQDVRGTDPYLLANKGVGTKTSGTYVTEKEVAEIVTEAIRGTLENLGYKVAGERGDLKLIGELLKFDSNAIMGFWSGQVESSLQVNLKLLDAKTDNPVWAEVISGYYKKGGVQVDHEGHRKEVSEGSLSDAMSKLAHSASFKSTVQNFKRP